MNDSPIYNWLHPRHCRTFERREGEDLDQKESRFQFFEDTEKLAKVHHTIANSVSQSLSIHVTCRLPPPTFASIFILDQPTTTHHRYPPLHAWEQERRPTAMEVQQTRKKLYQVWNTFDLRFNICTRPIQWSVN